MRPLTRVVSSVLAATVAGVVVGAIPASASTVGVGTTNTKTSVLDLQLGSLLNLALLTDTGGANIDPHAGALQAGTSLVPLTLSSPALKLNLSTPAITTLDPGGATNAASPALTLSSLGIPAALATATFKPASLHSDFTTGSAHSTMTAAEIDDLTVAGGAIASIDLLSSNLGADALSAQADGTRGVKIGTIKLLDLGALLKGLGIDLASLPVGSVSQLLSQLNLPVPAVSGLSGATGATSLAGEVASLSDALTSLRQTLVNATTQITTPVDGLTQGLLGKLGLPVPTVGSLVSQVNTLVGTLQTTLTNLLTTVLKSLDSFPLIQISGTQLGIHTTAADTLGHSAAGVTIAPMTITVAGVQLPALDLQQTVDTVNSVIATANSTLNNLLGTLGLPTNLLSLSLLNRATNVAQAGDYTTAAAGITMLTAKLAALDPSVITGVLSKLTGTTVGSLLGGTPLTGLLGASDSMSTLGGLVGQVAPLLGGANLRIASLAGASTYTFATPPAAVPTAAPSARTPTEVVLPHTGGNPALALIGVILAALALAIVRWRRVLRMQSAPVSGN